VLSGAHLELVPAVVDGLRAQGLDDVPVVVGGIVPAADAEALAAAGVAAVFTPADHDLGAILVRVVGVVRAAHGLAALPLADVPASGRAGEPVTSRGGSPSAPAPRRGSAPVP
jgi:(2R)-ethylmalonyl-CoA mutase